MLSFFEKIKQGLTKTKEGFIDEISSLVKNQFEIDDDFIDKVEEILITSDIGVATSMEIVDDLRDHVNRIGFGQKDELFTFLREHLSKSLDKTTSDFVDRFFQPKKKPYVIMLVGVNGVGKTTTIAKLAKLFHQKGKTVLLAAADTFRAAATEQLEIWAKRVEAEVISTQQGADPAAIAFDAGKAALARDIDVLIVDTAGRLHTKINLMEELKKINRVLDKAVDGAPHETLLVLDATTGQNAIMQAKKFKEVVDVTGLVVTKLDGTAKGGMIFSIQKELQLPVRFVGLGEQVDDLKPFDSETFVEALFNEN